MTPQGIERYTVIGENMIFDTKAQTVIQTSDIDTIVRRLNNHSHKEEVLTEFLFKRIHKRMKEGDKK